MLGIIAVEHLEVPCVIGVNPDERKALQTIFVDLKIECDFTPCIQSDKLQDTVDYVFLAKICKEVAVNGNYKLLETFAFDVLHTILLDQRISWAWIRVKKPFAIDAAHCTMIELEQFQGVHHALDIGNRGSQEARS